jgi:hypothetical protein
MIAESVLDLHNKRPTTGEIIVTLFEFCDLSCLFCNQDHNSILGVDTIVDKFEQIKLSIEKLIPKGKTEFSIHVMGGEVFSDMLDDKVYDDYIKLVDKIRNYGIEKNIPISISFITNFIWTKTERVQQFIEKTNVDLMTSYDPSGRFNKNTLEIFKNNVMNFKTHIATVNIVLTKPSINKFLNNQIPFFDYLYENIETYFDYYGPEKNQHFLLPTDIELRDFMIYLVNNWPKSMPVKDFFSKSKQKMTCMDTYTVMPTGKWGGCGHFENIEKIIPIKMVTEQAWIDNYNCFECEHFQRCSLGCFMSNHVNGMRTQHECWLKEVYDYINLKT